MLTFTGSQEDKQAKRSSPSASSRQLVTLMLGIPVAMLSAVRGDYVLAGSLTIALMATTYDKQLVKPLKKVKVKLKIWQMVAGISIAAILMGILQPVTVLAGPTGGGGGAPAPGGGGQGLFSPLQNQTNTVLTQAGANAAASSITGIFGLMNILVAIAGVSAVVYGGYQQSQGHTLRESFTPLAVVLLVYVGCSFVMRLFLGATP